MDFGNTTVSGTHSIAGVRLGTAGNGNVGNITFDDLDITSTGPGVSATANTGTTTISAGTISTGTGTAIDLASNTGGTFNFGGGAGGVDITTTSGTGFSATGGGTVSVTGASNTVNSTGATAVNLNGVTVSASGLAFASTDSGGGARGVNLDTVTGTGDINLGTGTLSGHSAAEIDINAGSGNVSYGGTIGNGSGLSAEISSHTAGTISLSGNINDTNDAGGGISVFSNTGGTINFSGTTKTLNTGATDGVNLTNNNGAAINFTNGGLDIDTTSGKGFTATGAGPGATTGGTITVTGTGNHLTSTTGTALNIVNTTIGGGGVTFEDISANGGTNGIVLNNTGSGGLTVTGTGTTAGSGGTIQGTVQGALFTSTSNLSLSNMNFTNANSGNGTVNNIDGPTFNSAAQAAINLSSVSTAAFTNLNVNGNGGAGGAQVGINGQTVSNLTIANSTVSGFGDAANEGDVKLFNLSGTSSITNSIFGFAAGDTTAGEQLIDIRNNTGTLTLNATGNTFNTTRTSANGGTQLQVTAVSNSTINLNASNNDFLATKTAGIATFARDTSTMNVNITDGGTAGNGNNFDRQAGLSRAIDLNAEDTAHLNFNVNRNLLISGSGGPVINVFGINSAVINGRIDNNGDIRGGGAGSVGSPIFIHPEDNATGVVEIKSNTITLVGNDPGILASIHGDGAAAVNAALDVRIQANNISMVGSNTFGIELASGSSNSDLTKLYADVLNNAVTVGGSGNLAFGILNAGGPGTFIYLQGFTIDGETTWNNRGNTPLSSYAEELNNPLAAVPAGHNGGVVQTPSNPTALFAAAGGVASASNSPGETHLTQSQLDGAVAAAIAIWSAAGLSANQTAALQHVTYDVADITGGWLGQSTPGHVTIDVNADGHGWFVDQTPADNSEFAHAKSATDLVADPSSAAAGHMDLITTVLHEMGEQLGLEDKFAPADQGSLMYANLGTGERLLPSGSDVAQAEAGSALLQALVAEAAVPVSARASASAAIVTGSPGNDIIDAGNGGNILFGGAGADKFVFGPSIQLNAPTPAQITHVADYSAAQGDTFDFSALTSAFHNSSASDALVVRAVEDASGKFATLQVDHIDPMGLPSAPNWVSVAQLDGAHAGDAVNVLIDNHSAIHLAQIHVDLLV